MRIARRATVLTCLAAVAGACAEAPRPTVELSEVMGEQITALQSSHESFVRLYYDELREDVELFLEREWIPRFLEHTVSGESESSRRLLADLEAAVEARDESLGEVMLGYSQDVVPRIEARRASLLRPIDAQERLVIGEIRSAYADLHRANLTVRAYLASVVDVAREREIVLDRLELLEQTRELMDAAVAANDGARSLLSEAQEADEAVDRLQDQLEETLARLQAIRDRLSGEGGGGAEDGATP